MKMSTKDERMTFRTFCSVLREIDGNRKHLATKQQGNMDDGKTFRSRNFKETVSSNNGSPLIFRQLLPSGSTISPFLGETFLNEKFLSITYLES